MHVLVTGGAGYIGSMLVPALLEREHHVTVLDTFSSGDPILASSCLHPRFEPIRGDARDMRLVEPLLHSADLIIPLAALVGAPLCSRDMVGATTLNRDAILDLVKRVSPEQWMIYPTTNSGYGIGAADAWCTEETPLRPISLYGTTKMEAEAAVLSRRASISLRLATVFGMAARMRLDLLVNDFVWRAVNDRAVVIFEGHFRRNFVHIRDVAGAFVHGMAEFERMASQAYNVGLSEANLSKLQLCERIARHVPGFVYLEAPIGEDQDKRDYIVSNEKIEATGWRPKVQLDDGIGELIKGYRMLRNGRFSNV